MWYAITISMSVSREERNKTGTRGFCKGTAHWGIKSGFYSKYVTQHEVIILAYDSFPGEAKLAFMQ